MVLSFLYFFGALKGRFTSIVKKRTIMQSRKIHPKQLHLLRDLGVNQLPKSQQLLCRNGLRVLGCFSLNEAKNLDPEMIHKKIRLAPNARRAYKYVAQFFRLCDLEDMIPDVSTIKSKVPRPTRLTTNQREWLTSLGIDKLSGRKKSDVICGVRILDVANTNELKALSADEIKSKVHCHGYRRITYVNELLRWCDLEHLCIQQTYRNGLTLDDEKALFEQLSIKALPMYHQTCLRTGIRVLGCKTIEEINKLSIERICECIKNNPTGEDNARVAVNTILNTIERGVIVTKKMVQNFIEGFPLDMNANERRWILDHLEHKDMYLDIRQRACTEIKESIGVKDITSRHHVSVMGRLTQRLLMVSPSMTPTVEQIIHSLVELIAEINTSKDSLAMQGRPSRSGLDNNHLKFNASKTSSSALHLMRVLKLDAIDAQLFRNKVWNRYCAHPLYPKSNDTSLYTFVDCLSLNEIQKSQQSTENLRDAAIITLLGKLGMRQGGVRNLRIAGVVDAFEKLEPKMEKWIVRDIIVGEDKGDKKLCHNTRINPEVNYILSDYINLYWRPKYENWILNEKGALQLRTGYLFPGQSVNRPLQSKSVDNVVKKSLKTAGVEDRKRTHSHAFRKGFITEMLRAGNSMEQVAEMVGHNSPETTRKSYDKRSPSERLGTIRTPDWTGKTRVDEGNDLPSSANTETSTDDTGSTVEQAKLLITEQSIHIDDLKDQLEVALAQLSPAQKTHWTKTCQERGTLE